MDVEEKVALVKKPPTVEVLTEQELKSLFETNSRPRHYIGFEISGRVHLGTGLATALKIMDFIKAGIKPTIFLADYHAWINGKMGGDLEKIQQIAKGYFKHAFISLGLEEGKVDYVLASEIYDNDYWKGVLAISKSTTIARMLRCTTIMGRAQKDTMDSASIFYPAMQAADIWKLGVDIAHAGMDQRKVHVLARELSQKMKKKKPVAVHGRLLSSLQGAGRMDGILNVKKEVQVKARPGMPTLKTEKTTYKFTPVQTESQMIEGKMSKSNPKSCIFIDDTPEDIKKKVLSAHCPPKIVQGNPVVEMAEFFLLRGKPMKASRPAKFGGDIEFANADELKLEYSRGSLHPLDLKSAVAEGIISLLEPTRNYFQKNQEFKWKG